MVFCSSVLISGAGPREPPPLVHAPTRRADAIAIAGTVRLVMGGSFRGRAASRVLVRLGAFHADSFHELERRSARLDLGAVVARGRPVRVRASCHKSRLYHSTAVADRVLAAAVRAGARPPAPTGGNTNTD